MVTVLAVAFPKSEVSEVKLLTLAVVVVMPPNIFRGWSSITLIVFGIVRLLLSGEIWMFKSSIVKDVEEPVLESVLESVLDSVLGLKDSRK